MTYCAEEFAKGKYDDALAQAVEIMHVHKFSTMPLVQLALISAQRLGRADEVEGSSALSRYLSRRRLRRTGKRLADIVLNGKDFTPWEKSMIQISLGTKNAPTLMRQSGSSEKRCQATFYYGNRLLTEGKRDEAIKVLRECAAMDAEQLDEIDLARLQLMKL